MEKLFKIVIYVPIDSAGKIRQVLSEAGAGQIGNYDSTSFSVIGTGRFRPLDGAHPTIGKKGALVKVAEERIETVVQESKLFAVLTEIRSVHPYEEPAIDVYELYNDSGSTAV